MKEEYLIYLTIQIYIEFKLYNKWLLIDIFYEKLNEIYKDYLKYDNKNMSLLDSVNKYLSDNKDRVFNIIKDSFELEVEG